MSRNHWPRRGLLNLLASQARQDLPILTSTEFSRVFEAERVRTERTGSVFSVLRIQVVEAPSSQGLRDAAILLDREARLYDSVGRLGASTLGALLPETDPEGAQAFADRLIRAFGEAGIAAEVTIFVYPMDWEDDLDGGLDPLPGSAEGPSHTQRPWHRRPRQGAFLVMDPEPAQDLEPQLVQGLPAWKRGLDLLVATPVVLLGGLTVLPLVALAIRLDSKGGTFYKQRRVGRGGKEFDFWKFRSMRPAAHEERAQLEGKNEKTGPIFKIENDPRITRVGRFLRKTSIDELPQFWNVLRGDMTLVGPRPPLPQEVEEYEPWQRRRLDVVPGLTCTWQIGGRSTIAFVDWMRMDVRYIRERNALKDLNILARTPLAVVRGRGAY